MANPMIPMPADVVAPPTAPAATPPMAPAEAAAMAPEIAFLKQHGMEAEAAELGAQLESILKASGEGTQPGLPQSAPITQPNAFQAPQAQQTAMEKALDPLAPEGVRESAEGSDGELVEGVVIDSNGRARDAQTGQYVPLKALHRERDKVKDLRSELQQQREMNARVEERLAVLNELLASGGELPQTQQQQQQAPAPDPLAPPSLDDLVDPDVDIFKSAKQMQDYLKKYADYAARLKSELDNAVEAKIKPTQQQIQEMSVSQAIQRDLSSFVAKNPDLPDAYKHLRNARAAGLKVVGFGSDEEIATYLNNEEKVLQQRSLSQNKSFSQAIYDLAKTYGYQKQGESAPTPEATPASVAAQQAPAAPQAQPAPAVDPAAAAKVQALAAAQQQAGATLNGHGGTPAEGLTVQQLVNMNDAQFLDLAAKLGKSNGGTGSGLRKLDELLRGL